MKKSESGRSMVEMLGVLAIIGVLSVGGIAGYSLGMRKHRVNQIADTASKYALITYNQCQQKRLNGEPHSIEYISEFKDTGIGQLPAGVKQIMTPDVQFDQNDGTDHVNFSVEFDDDTLCKAYGATVGSECDYSYGKPVVTQTIKQN